MIFANNPLPFYRWAANTITACGGDGGLYLRRVEREWLLTFAETRMATRQVGFELYFHGENSEFMRPSQLGTTNKRWIH